MKYMIDSLALVVHLLVSRLSLSCFYCRYWHFSFSPTLLWRKIHCITIQHAGIFSFWINCFSQNDQKYKNIGLSSLFASYVGIQQSVSFEWDLYHSWKGPNIKNEMSYAYFMNLTPPPPPRMQNFTVSRTSNFAWNIVISQTLQDKFTTIHGYQNI